MQLTKAKICNLEEISKDLSKVHAGFHMMIFCSDKLNIGSFGGFVETSFEIQKCSSSASSRCKSDAEIDDFMQNIRVD